MGGRDAGGKRIAADKAVAEAIGVRKKTIRSASSAGTVCEAGLSDAEIVKLKKDKALLCTRRVLTGKQFSLLYTVGKN